MNRSPLVNKPIQANTKFLGPTQAYPQTKRAFPQAEPTPAVTAHCLFAPINYEPGYAYPLIVWLHGPESNEQEVKQVMPLISYRNHVAVAPRGTRSSGQHRGAFNWGNTPEDIYQAGERVEHSIEIAKQQFNIHPDRIFVAGFSTGGTLALRLGMENPDLVAGAISLGGPMPKGHRPFRNINHARQLPLLLSVSPNENYSLPKVMDDLRLLRYAGFSLSLRLNPEGDELTTKMLSDVNAWIMEQFCPSISQAS